MARFSFLLSLKFSEFIWCVFVHVSGAWWIGTIWLWFNYVIFFVTFSFLHQFEFNDFANPSINSDHLSQNPIKMTLAPDNHRTDGSMTFIATGNKTRKFPPQKYIYNFCYCWRTNKIKRHLPGGRELDWLTSCQASTINVNVPWKLCKKQKE